MSSDVLLCCIKCNQVRDVGRRLCKNCYREEKRRYSRERYYNDPSVRLVKLVCVVCSLPFLGWRKQQLCCPDCHKLRRKLAKDASVSNQYVMVGCRGEHRVIAESILGELESNMVVHHVDGNPKNNLTTNLMVMNRKAHAQLHRYLELQRVIVEKSTNENHGNCWDTLIVPMTTTWLEMTGVNVIKLWEIGQSAADPL